MLRYINEKMNGHGERSNRIRRNIALSLLIKAASIAINFSIVPLTINYVDSTRYGIWITLTSIVSWFTFFDFGLGNSLRNELTRYTADGDSVSARKLVSTTYLVLFLLAGSLFVVFSLIKPFIDWNRILNVPDTIAENMGNVLQIVLAVFCLQFVLQLLNTVLFSLQMSARVDLLVLFGQLLLLLVLLVLINTVPGNLTILALALGLAPVFVLFCASIFYYKGRLKFLSPSAWQFDIMAARKIVNLGGVFFVLQIGSQVLLQTDNIIIANLLNPSEVTRFNVCFKLFSAFTIAFSIVLSPYWAAVTESYAKADFEWIRSSLVRLRKIWWLVVLVLIPCFLLLSKTIFRFWLGEGVVVGSRLSILMGLYIANYTGLLLTCTYLNAMSKLRLQLLLYILVILTNIPTAIFLGKKWGTEGVLFANIAFFLFMNSLLWIQLDKLTNKSARGWWNR